MILYITLNLDLYTAVLGGEVMVDTLDGKIKLKVNPGTQNGYKIPFERARASRFTKRKDLLVTFLLPIIF